MKATGSTAAAVRQKASKEVRYASKEELMAKKRERLAETFKNIDPEQLQKFFNREI